ncbi:MAG TPA: hypothetical protein VHE34_27555 [Puia sp.]|uniref:hypothetical protein n=1 Tax=Puia sp. TaxID=2045100 RepID=UPI002C11E3BA|nr:hypothetical protein [Puia sp.]HVU99021.1 hypothetical protein [Puia sp.]
MKSKIHELLEISIVRVSKKLPGLLLLLIIAFQPGCKRNNDTVAEVTANVRYGGEPAADGFGYYIRLNSSEVVIPINLPSTYRHTDVNDSVAVRLIDVGKRFHLGYTEPNSMGLRGVYIATIRKL